MPTPNAKFFGPQHWNAIAKDIRTEAQQHMARPGATRNAARVAMLHALQDLALRFAVRFKTDNDTFEPFKWLDQCSPDVDRYPFSELWEGE